jgi:hypothetical protein
MAEYLENEYDDEEPDRHEDRVCELESTVDDAIGGIIEDLEPTNAEVVAVLDRIRFRFLQAGEADDHEPEIPNPGAN